MEFVEVLQEKFAQRGFTMWSNISGRGTNGGEPHEGSHAWPTMNNAILTVVEDEKVDGILEEVRAMDKTTPGLGVRAFVLPVDRVY